FQLCVRWTAWAVDARLGCSRCFSGRSARSASAMVFFFFGGTLLVARKYGYVSYTQTRLRPPDVFFKCVKSLRAISMAGHRRGTGTTWCHTVRIISPVVHMSSA